MRKDKLNIFWLHHSKKVIYSILFLIMLTFIVLIQFNEKEVELRTKDEVEIEEKIISKFDLMEMEYDEMLKSNKKSEVNEIEVLDFEGKKNEIEEVINKGEWEW